MDGGDDENVRPCDEGLVEPVCLRSSPPAATAGGRLLEGKEKGEEPAGGRRALRPDESVPHLTPRLIWRSSYTPETGR